MVKVGAAVNLLMTFGNQKRFKCPHCKKFMPVTQGDVTCRGCGTVYAVSGDRYIVESVPQESLA